MNGSFSVRPALSPEETAALAAAIDELLASRQAVVMDTTPAWRFSGRWFGEGRFEMRRPRRRL